LERAVIITYSASAPIILPTGVFGVIFPTGDLSFFC
jgi:hypothetical protein